MPTFPQSITRRDLVVGGHAAISPSCGYESPMEDLPTPSRPDSGHGTPSPLGGGPRMTPGFPNRPAGSGPAHGSASPQRPGPPVGEASSSSLNHMLANAEKMPGRKVGIRDRIACYQWTWFTMTMATGGLANVIHSLPYKAEWLTIIGTFFFILNLCLFLMNCVLISIRFHLRPGSFVNSFTDQVESLFIPAFFVSLAIIFINICEYGIPNVRGPWLLRTMEVMFWIYIALSTFASAGMYLILWSTLIFPIHMMTPTWVFPAYPLLLTAPFAANLIAAAATTHHTEHLHTTAVAMCAVTTQGTGCLIAFMISAAFVYRLMTQKLPRDMQRPGVFISIGPFAFTVAGIGSQADLIIPPSFSLTDTSSAIFEIKLISLLMGLWLWGLSMWFFLVSVGSLWKYVRPGCRMPFQMTWWSFVFPNTALVTATEALGKAFGSDGLTIFGSVMAACLIVVWVGVFGTMISCLRKKQLLWPKEAP